MQTWQRQLGQWAEQRAAQYLIQQGYQLQLCNWHCRYGELDLILTQAQQLILVEVKARCLSSYGKAIDVVSINKQLKLMKSALCLIEQHPIWANYEIRFDVVAIDIVTKQQQAQCSSLDGMQYQIQWIENAFTFDTDFINL